MTAAIFAIYMHNDPEIRNLELKHKYPLYLLSEQNWEHLIKRKLPSSDYPIDVQNQIAAVMRPINFEIVQWTNAHKDIFQDCFPKKIHICWKSEGTIDHLRTADLLIKSQELSLETRFVLACQYWTWEAILEFWKTLSASHQFDIFYDYTDVGKNPEQHLENVARWIKVFQCKISLDTPVSKVWSRMLVRSNVSIWSRAFDQLPFFYKQILLMRVFFIRVNIPLARICLSRMTPEEQIRMLQLYPYHVLRIYLFWPSQTSFSDAAATVKDTLSNRSFLYLIHIMICQKILLGWRDSDYADLLRRFWRESPERCREYVKGDAIFEILMAILEDKEFCSSLRRDVPQRYLIHKTTLFKNAIKCVNMSDAHKDD
ncbi:uncharacterized protein TNCV_3211621 [Trichonephila clavipes]|uniref:Uncharacterized protein n=1 Tax=Trichonephila clavipes TaxID=2585209 RepID=A0A8X6S2R5_TRICX|nr:uncharacterized protein TNCV_3211621 [Trichonephila clavipes]